MSADDEPVTQVDGFSVAPAHRNCPMAQTEKQAISPSTCRMAILLGISLMVPVMFPGLAATVAGWLRAAGELNPDVTAGQVGAYGTVCIYTLTVCVVLCLLRDIAAAGRVAKDQTIR